MIEFGIDSDTMINRGMLGARACGKSWLPSPGEFCRWCLPTLKEYGLTSEANAFAEARKESGKDPKWRKWSHKAVYIATQATGFFDLKTLADNDKMYHDVKKRFLEHYKEAVSKVMAGKELDIPPENRIEPIKEGWNKNRRNKANKDAMNKFRGMFDE